MIYTQMHHWERLQLLLLAFQQPPLSPAKAIKHWTYNSASVLAEMPVQSPLLDLTT